MMVESGYGSTGYLKTIACIHGARVKLRFGDIDFAKTLYGNGGSGDDSPALHEMYFAEVTAGNQITDLPGLPDWPTFFNFFSFGEAHGSSLTH